MTNEQAIEVLKQRRQDYETIIKMNLPNSEIQRRKELSEATKLAIQALEKQVPKKIKRTLTDSTSCSNCDEEIYYWMEKHCHNCGQALDWSES